MRGIHHESLSGFSSRFRDRLRLTATSYFSRDLGTTRLNIESLDDRGLVCCLSSLSVRSICMCTMIVCLAPTQYGHEQRVATSRLSKDKGTLEGLGYSETISASRDRESPTAEESSF